MIASFNKPTPNQTVGKRMKKSWKILAAIGCVGFLTAIVGAVHVYRGAMQSISDGYALWGTSEIIIAHHWRTSSWPRTWDELEGYEKYGRHLAGHSIEDLERFVAVDFPSISRLNEGELTQMNEFISLRSGRSGVWRRPQEIFADYMADPEEFARRELWTTLAEPHAK